MSLNKTDYIGEGEEMKKLCYLCSKDRDKNGYHEAKVLYELCDKCARWLNHLNKEKVKK